MNETLQLWCFVVGVPSLFSFGTIIFLVEHHRRATLRRQAKNEMRKRSHPKLRTSSIPTDAPNTPGT